MLAPKDKSKIEVKNKKVFIDREEVVKYLQPVTCPELFPDKVEKDKQEKIKLAAADPIEYDHSVFQAFAYKTGQIHEVRRAYRKIKRLNPAADHVIAAYTLRGHKGHQDDDEHGTSYRLLQKLIDEEVNNVAVYVVRSHGGVNLGPKRFELINQCGLQAVNRLLQN